MIISKFLLLLNEWSSVFEQSRTHMLSIQMAMALLCNLGRNTISSRIVLLGRSQADWSKFYRLFNKRAWEVNDLFAGVLKGVLPWCRDGYLAVAGDDTLIHKTGKLIHNVGFLRDPLSPKFRYNLAMGLRYIQLSVLVPLYLQFPKDVVSAVALPVRFMLAPVIRKPKGMKKPMTQAEEQAFQKLKDANTLSQYMAKMIPELRKSMDANGLHAKILLMVVDNGYCNKIVLAVIKARIQLLARLRKNSRLFLEGTEAGAGFTPEEIRKDEKIPFQKCQALLGRAKVVLKYKIVEKVVWPSGANKRVMRLIVIASTPYRRRKNAKINYRQPGFLLSTDIKAPIEMLIQSYLDRWQIEVNHREEKTVIGVGQAQVWTKEAVTREPAFAVAAYSLLKLATLQALGPIRTEDYGELPGWYAGSARPSCEDMLQKMRREAWEHPELLEPYGVKITPKGLIAATRA